MLYKNRKPVLDACKTSCRRFKIVLHLENWLGVLAINRGNTQTIQFPYFTFCFCKDDKKPS